MFEDYDIIFFCEDLESGFFVEGLIAGVVDPDIPIVEGVVCPAVGFIFWEWGFGDLVVGVIVGVIIIEPLGYAAFPDAVSGAVVEEDDFRVFVQFFHVLVLQLKRIFCR